MALHRPLLLLSLFSAMILKAGPIGLSDSIKTPAKDSITVFMLNDIEVVAAPTAISVKADRISYRLDHTKSYGSVYNAIESLPGIDIDSSGEITRYGLQKLALYIDGRKTILSGENLINYLKSLSAAEISKIEIQESAGAKGEGSGPIGTLNLVRKHKRDEHYSLGLSFDGQLGRARQGYGALFMNYNSNKYSIGVNYSTYRAKKPSELSTVRPYLDFEESLIQTYSRNRQDGLHYLAVSSDYLLNSDIKIGATLNFNHFRRDEKAGMRTVIPFEPTPAVTSNDAAFITNNLFGDLYLRRLLSDSRGNWILAGDFFKNNSSERQLMTDNTGKGVDGSVDGNTFGVVGNFDYNRSLSERYQLSAGMRASYINMKSGGAYTSSLNEDKKTIQEAFVDNSKVSGDDYGSDFGYTENVNAVYVDIEGTLGKTNISAGLRAEYSTLKSYFSGNESYGRQDSLRADFHLYPSLSFMYSSSRLWSLMLTYTHKATRPQFSDLDPFIHLFDDITHVGGNISLKAASRHYITLIWSDNRWLRVIFTGEHVTGDIVKYYRMLNDRVVYVTPENIPGHLQLVTGLSCSNLKLMSWWQLSASAMMIYSSYRFQKDTRLRPNTILTPLLDLKTQLTIPYDISIEAGCSFRGRTAYGQARLSHVWNSFAEIRRIFYNGRLSLTLFIKDIFNSNHFTSTIFISGRKASLMEKEHEDMRRMGVAFSWNLEGGIGKSRKEERRSRIEELDRVKL